MRYEKLTRLWLKDHSQLNERWVQERIAEDPAILGLGDVILKDKERIQPRAGRLDLLLQEADGSRRYEVEIQLGKTDESHIIRTIEYWDIERKRYPQYDHTAVIVAEEITSRFLNVIGLFNGVIPVVAIQMSAVQLSDAVALLFTTVVDQMTLGLVDEEEEAEPTDRSYWESRATKTTVAMADEVLEIIRTFEPSIELKFNKFYIGLAADGRPNNFVVLRPQKNAIRIEPRIKKTDAIEAKIEAAGLDVMDYDNKWNRYRIRLAKGDVSKHAEVLRELLEAAYHAAAGSEA